MQSWVAVLEEKMPYACIVCSAQKFIRLDYCNAATTVVSLDTATTTGDRIYVGNDNGRPNVPPPNDTQKPIQRNT